MVSGTVILPSMQDCLPLQLCSKHYTVASTKASKAFLNEYFKENFVLELVEMTPYSRVITRKKRA
jgi:hypothetical protein